MAPTYTGSLQSKKKSELQEIASALYIADHGTKDELQIRIKKHLDHNQSELEDDERFAGLYGGRRRRSAQPQESAPPPSKRSSGKSSESKGTRRVIALEPVFESTPAKDLSDVSTLLKNPLSPDRSPRSPTRRVTRSGLVLTSTPSSLPPLPPSPAMSTALERSVLERSIIEHIPRPRMGSIVGAMRRREQAILRKSNSMLLTSRAFLSNSRTISTITAASELLYILYMIIPWRYLHIPLTTFSTASPDTPSSSFSAEPSVVPSPQGWGLAASVVIPYPPLFTFQSSFFWTVLMHWLIPTVLIPVVAGILVSFKQPTSAVSTESPAASRELVRASDDGIASESGPEHQDAQVKSAISFDPLTASIIRLAAQVAYPYPARPPLSLAYGVSSTIDGYDVLGFRWRILTASVGVAFAFAEAIHLSLASSSPSSSQGVAVPHSRRPLLPEDTMVDSEEVD